MSVDVFLSELSLKWQRDTNQKKETVGFSVDIPALCYMSIKINGDRLMFITINPWGEKSIDFVLEGTQDQALYWCEGWFVGYYNSPRVNVRLK